MEDEIDTVESIAVESIAVESIGFSDLGLRPEIQRAVADAGYTTPTPIQAKAIPVVLQGRDMLGIAQTGTGKTAGFTLPMIQMLAQGRSRIRMPRSLILEPTRELAAQVAENFEKYGRYERLSYALLIGGSSFEEQIRKLERGVDVLIATPGRMLDLFERGKVLLADAKILVIDEADRMLDMGFIPDIERIVGLLPAARQTLFFSATMPPEIRRLADAFLTNPEEIAVARPATTSTSVEQYVVVVHQEDKRKALRQLLRHEDVRNALIFCNRKRDVGILYRSLEKHGFSAGQLHGDMVQSVRTQTLERFKRGEVRLLVCSDVAARGIDIHDLSHVFNFDVPSHAEDYVHRIGRTARAGRQGRAFALATPGDTRYLAAINKLINQNIPEVKLDSLSADLEPDDGHKKRRRRNDKAAVGDAAKADRRGQPPKRGKGDRPAAEAGGGKGDRPAAEAGGGKGDRPAAEAGGGKGDRPAAEAGGGRRDRPAAEAGGGRRDRPAAEAGGGRRDRRKGGEDRGDEPVVGLGDHVPAFLLRPVRRRNTAESDSELV